MIKWPERIGEIQFLLFSIYEGHEVLEKDSRPSRRSTSAVPTITLSGSGGGGGNNKLSKSEKGNNM